LGCVRVFFGHSLRLLRAAKRRPESAQWPRTSLRARASTCVAIGLFPAFFWPAVAHATAAWQPAWQELATPAPLVTLGICHVALVAIGALAAAALWGRVRRNGLRRDVTWDCGYAAPTPRMQYTAGSFASIITGWFAWILRPQRHVHPPGGPLGLPLFPAHASHSVHTPETVLEHVVEPVGDAVMSTSNAVRRLQHGRLQAYILYLVIGLVAVALIVFAGAGK